MIVHGDKHGSSFSFLQADTQFSQQHLLKRLSFLHHMFLVTLSKIRWPYLHGFISGSSVLFHWSSCLFLCQYHAVFNCYCFVVQFEVGYCDTSSLLFLVSIVLAICDLLCLQMNFRVAFSVSVMYVIRIDGNCIEHVDCFW
jgi:hypothetical protein